MQSVFPFEEQHGVYQDSCYNHENDINNIESLEDNDNSNNQVEQQEAEPG